MWTNSIRPKVLPEPELPQIETPEPEATAFTFTLGKPAAVPTPVELFRQQLGQPAPAKVMTLKKGKEINAPAPVQTPAKMGCAKCSRKAKQKGTDEK